MITAEQVLPILQVLVQGDSPAYQEAATSAEQMLQNKGIIFPLIEIAGTHSVALVRQLAFIFASRYLNNVWEYTRNTESLEGFPDFTALKDPFLRMLSGETDQMVFNMMCKALEPLIALLMEFSEWPEIAALGKQLLQNEVTVHRGLHVMMVGYEAFPDEIQDECRTIVGNAAIAALGHGNSDVRTVALDVISEVVFLLLETSDVMMFGSLPEALKVLAQNVVYVWKNEKEVANVFSTIGDIMFDRFREFDAVSPSFCEFAMRVACDPSVSLEIRITVQQVLDRAPLVIREWFAERFQECVKVTLALSLEACREERDMTGYMFCSKFLKRLAGVCDAYEFMEVMTHYAEVMFASGEPAQQQTILAAVDAVAEECADAIISADEFWVRILSAGLNSEDEFVCAATNDLLRTMAGFGSAFLATSLDSIVECLIKRIADVRFIRTLEAVLDEADRSIQHLDALISGLLGMLGSVSDNTDCILDCISAAIKHADVNDELFVQISPVLLTLLRTNEALSVNVFQCFEMLSHVSPNSMAGQLDNILMFLFSGGDVKLAVMQPLCRFVEKFPVQMAKYGAQCMAVVHRAVAIEYRPELSPDELSARSAGVRCWAYMDPRHADFSAFALHMLGSFYGDDQRAAAVAISIALPQMVSAGIDTAPVFERLLGEAAGNNDRDVVREVMAALSIAVSTVPPALVIAASDSINKIVMGALSGSLTCLNQKNAGSTELVVIPAVCGLLYYWANILGAGFDRFIGQYRDHFGRILGGRNNTMKGMVILGLVEIGLAMNSEEIIQLAAMNAVQALSIKHVIMRTHVLNAINLLVRQCPAVIADAQTRIKPVVERIVHGASTDNYARFEAAVALWSSCINAYGWEVTPDVLFSVMEHVDVECEEDMGRSGDFAGLCAKFAQHVSQGQMTHVVKIAVRVLAETDWLLNRVDSNIVQFARSVLMTLPDVPGEVARILGFNQRMSQVVLGRLQPKSA